MNSYLADFLLSLSSIEFCPEFDSHRVFLIKNTSYHIIIVNNFLFIHKIGEPFYGLQLDEIWDKLPNEFKMDAAFNLEVFNKYLFCPKAI